MKEDISVSKNMEEVIKKDNKKARWKFILILIVSGVIGGIVGFISAMTSMSLPTLAEAFDEFMTVNMGMFAVLAPVAIVVVTAIIAVWSMYNVSYSKKNAFTLIEADEEEALERLEKKLSYNICATSLLLIFQYLVFSIMVFADYKYSNTPKSLVYTLIAFVIGMFAVIILQQKIVDCTRLINPEKKGSVYEFKFEKKWEESCDEAEKMVIYKAAYRAYRAANMTCVILWVIFMVIGLSTGVGFLAVLSVIIIWTVLVSVYSYYSIKDSK